VEVTLRIKNERLGALLGTRPEQLSAGSRLIWREVVKQLGDVVMEVDLPKATCPSNTVIKARRLLVDLKYNGLSMKYLGLFKNEIMPLQEYILEIS